MNSACTAFRASLVAPEDFAASAVGLHAAECAACTAFVARLERARRDLAALPRRPAPFELEGRVVAGCEAGTRQERGVSVVRELARLQVPHQLERVVHADVNPLAVGAQPTPDVLRRLVEEELAQPEAARTRRFVGGLPRVAAPVELAVELDHALRSPALGARTSRRLLLTVGALLSVILVGSLVWLDRSETAPRSLKVIQVDGVDGFSGLGRDLFGGLSGGASELWLSKGDG